MNTYKPIWRHLCQWFQQSTFVCAKNFENPIFNISYNHYSSKTVFFVTPMTRQYLCVCS